MKAIQPHPSQQARPEFSLLGTTAALFTPAGEFDLLTQRRILALAEEVESWPDVAEAVPGVTNLMLMFSRPPADPQAVAARLLRSWKSVQPIVLAGRHVDLGVTYGGDAGPHLADVAARTGLSIDDVVAVHTAPTYTVYAIGSHPGYCYLGGLDPRLFLPRRDVPLVSIPKGSLSVAGMQTGVAASAGPSGWHTIGGVDVDFFEPKRSPPLLLQPGDTIRFVAERVCR